MTTRENLKKYRQLYYKKPKKRAKFLQSIFSGFLIWQLIVWQLVFSFNLQTASASDTDVQTEASVSVAPSQSAASDNTEVEAAEQKPDPSPAAESELPEKEGESVGAAEPAPELSSAQKDPSPSAVESSADEAVDASKDTQLAPEVSLDAENPENIWETCDLDAAQTNEIQKNDCEECQKKTNCDDIKICLEAFVQNSNKAVVQNDGTSISNTGGNEVDGNAPTSSFGQDQVVQGAVPQGGESDAEAQNPETNSDSAPGESEKSDQAETMEDSGDEKSDDATAVAAEIESGDANATTNILNTVNINAIGNNILNYTENITNDFNGDINLLDKFNSLLEDSQDSGDQAASANGATLVNVENNNDAIVQSTGLAVADTGNNIASGAEGDAVVDSGDADANVNIVNFVNQNIVGNNWLFATINVFGNWLGDLIVPGDGLLSVPSGGGALIADVFNSNTADMKNSAIADAETGNNVAEGNSGDASVISGDATSSANVKSIVNTNIVKNNFFFLMINNMGSWTGKVLNWDKENGSYDTIFSYDFDELENASQGLVSWIYSVTNRNTAQVENNATAIANTGNNLASGNDGSAAVTSGNASAQANIVNFINMNIVGNNWMFGIVNVLGSWQGNVEFAYPDLSVSLSGNATKVKKGESFAYQVLVKNNGKADCEGVQVALALPDEVASSDENSWTIESLKVGEEESFLVNVAVSNDLPPSVVTLESQTEVATETKEVELANNSAKNQIEVYSDGANESGGSETVPAETQKVLNGSLLVSRSASKKKIKVGEILKQTIEVENTGEEVLNSVQIGDRLKNKKGGVSDYDWEVDRLDPGEKAVITYRLMVNPGAPTGTYESFASAHGVDGNGQNVTGNESKLAFGVGSVENENYYYYTYTDTESAPFTLVGGENGSIISTAQAASNEDGRVLGASSNAWNRPSDPSKFNPGWIIFPAAVLLISYLRRKRQKKIELR
jgi:hypothetical protein